MFPKISRFYENVYKNNPTPKYNTGFITPKEKIIISNTIIV